MINCDKPYSYQSFILCVLPLFCSIAWLNSSVPLTSPLTGLIHLSELNLHVAAPVLNISEDSRLCDSKSKKELHKLPHRRATSLRIRRAFVLPQNS